MVQDGRPKAENIFLKSVLTEVPRLLGQLNRNSSSKTYGSFDRAYWHYRTNDISCARYQEALYTLSLLYTNDFDGNVYFKNKLILEWVNSAIEFTISIQRRDGSFDEWYINEGSYVCTSFVSVAFAKSLMLLDRSEIRQYDLATVSLGRAADWLMRHEETAVLNQTAGSIAALHYIHFLTGRDDFRKAAEGKAQYLINEQSEEGWWREYGGPDIGYLSLAIDYLSQYFFASNDVRVMGAIKKACEFLVYFLHPDLTVGGEYMARNTEYLIPSGFFRLAAYDESAKKIAWFCHNSLAKETGVRPCNLDDRYLCYILYNWLEAGLMFTAQDFQSTTKPNGDLKYAVLPFLKGGLERSSVSGNKHFDNFFSRANIRVVSGDGFYFVANLSKGGAFRLYTGDSAYFDSGITAKIKGRWYTSHYNTAGAESGNKEDEMFTKGYLQPVREPLMATHAMLFFKAMQLMLGNLSFLRGIVKKFLRKRIIASGRVSGFEFTRLFTLRHGCLIIEDRINTGVRRDDIRVGEKFSHAFIPSAKYFIAEEIATHIVPEENFIHTTNDQTIITRMFKF